MLAALIPFATTQLLNVRALGIGVGIAILIDVLIVRPVLLPAAAALFGRFGWWPTVPARPSQTDPRVPDTDGAPPFRETPVAS
jgi:RND superfamily putative drug exporter